MKRIVLFGANCGKCKKTEANLRAVIEKCNLDAVLVKSEDVEEMVKHNVCYLPTVLIDDKIYFKGIVPSEKDIMRVLL